MNEQTVKDVIKTRNIIRKKYQALKSGKVQDASYIEEMLHPIINPLKKMADASTSEGAEPPAKIRKTSIKSEMETTPDYHYSMKPFPSWTPPLPASMENPEPKIELPMNIKQELDLEPSGSTTHLGDPRASDDDFEEQEEIPENELTATHQFIKKLSIPKEMRDSKYGIRWDKSGSVYKLGNSQVSILRGNMHINNDVYTLTPGLIQLLFSRYPKIKDCNENDIMTYLQLVRENNLLHRHYNRKLQNAGSRSKKYKLIRNLLKEAKQTHSLHTGSGIMRYSENKTDYVYWNDVNELVDRLRLLIASQQAGHSNHNNEIASILEELKEADIIV